MDNRGAFQLTNKGSAFQLSAPGVLTGGEMCDLEGMKSVTLQAKFLYGSGGATAILYVQTSLDQGQSWFDIWAQQFATQSDAKFVNVLADGVDTPTDLQSQALAPGTIVNALGDRLRAIVVVGETAYTGATLLNVTAVAR